MCRGGPIPHPAAISPHWSEAGAQHRALEHRCHSWVIQEINWGLGCKAASKGTL